MILCLTLCIQGEAQSFDSFINNLREHNRKSPQERVFLDYDCKDGCVVGDTIHFTAKVVRMDSLCVSDKSGVVYVELVNPGKTVVDFRKLSLDNRGMASGMVVVDSLFDSGFYLLRAYTRYQTNWNMGNVFSRVVPVYYPDDKISVKEKRKNAKAGFINLANSVYNAESNKKDFRTFLYIEGGSFMEGTPTNVGVHCYDAKGMPVSAQLRLADLVRGNCEVRGELDRFGNSVLNFSTQHISDMKLQAKSKKGNFEYDIRVRPKGVSLSVDACRKNDVQMRMYIHPDSVGSRFCTVILNRGNLLYCDTSVVDTVFRNVKFDKSMLGRGVHEIVVFSVGGAQVARRRFFVGKIQDEEEQWLLLDSELAERNRLPRDAYKTLTDKEIDNLLLVDETYVYPWFDMASQSRVTMYQPEEKRLMVFGRIMPMSKHPSKEDMQLDGRRFRLTLNQGELIYKSDIVCDGNGYFGSYFDGLKGEWMLMAHHSKDMDRQRVLILDDFSPKVTSPLYKNIQPELFGKKKWYTPKVKRYNDVYYNCDLYTKDRLSKGLISQSFYGWLGMYNRNMNKMKGAVSPVIVNILRDSTYNKHLDFNFFGTSSDDPRTVALDGPTYNGRPIVWIIDGQYRLVTGLQKKITDFEVLRPCRRHMPNFLDEVRSVYITEDPTAFYPYMRCSVLESKKPVTVFITLHKNYIWNDSGLVTAPFQGVE